MNEKIYYRIGSDHKNRLSQLLNVIAQFGKLSKIFVIFKSIANFLKN